jgi:hypothetical protein
MKVTGAGVGRQFIDGDPHKFEWSVRYEGSRGIFYHIVPNSRAVDPDAAMRVATRELGLSTV